MGASASSWHVRLCLTALADALAAQGRSVDLDAALSAAEARLG
jgi:alanine-glyoxylate transaminase/serine-glyoxylate transaminase/serine-pyruvate transaminase